MSVLFVVFVEKYNLYVGVRPSLAFKSTISITDCTLWVEHSRFLSDFFFFCLLLASIFGLFCLFQTWSFVDCDCLLVVNYSAY